MIDLIRGRNVSQALAILKFTDKRAADPIAKTLRSAIANATYKAEQQNIAIDPDDLWVKTCFVDMGAHKNRRRMRPAPQGRAYREQRHYCHITILVSSDEPPKKNIKESKKGKEGDKSSGEKPVAKKETKKAKQEQPKAEEVETPAVETQEAVETTETVETASTATDSTEQVETAATETSESNETTQAAAEESPSEQAEAQEAENDADASDVKDTNTQNPAELNETKRADDKQEDVNEQLERQ